MAAGASSAVTVWRCADMGRRDVTVTGHGQRALARDLPLPAPAPAQPGRLAAVGRGGAGPGARARASAARLDRLLGLPLVPRDGARVLRGPRGRRADERALRVREGRPRGAP